MNILIVDDNKNNRMILRLLLEDYMDENDSVILDIYEAQDGQIAVDKCKEKAFDIVLMDIMMPNMDGIEATRIIRKAHEKIMIIAVSAVDDSERKKLILNNGAEDYIAKPVNADIFISRMANYIILCEARKTKKVNSAIGVNLFSRNVYSRHTRFLMNCEDSLAEFWEFFLLNARKKSDKLSDVVRSIFAITEKQLQLGNDKNYLYIEESDDKQYFTLENIDVFPKKIIELILIKNTVKDGYKIEGSKLSFELSKVEQQEDISNVAVIADTSINEPEELLEVASDVVEEIKLTSSVELQVFDYMEADDLYELEEFAQKLNSIMLIVGSGDITEEEVMDIYTYLEQLASVLSTYVEVYPISKALSELSLAMSSYSQVFIDNSEALGPMCKAFSNDMSNWIEQSFHSGAPSIDFMNDTIVVNCQTIGGMLNMNDTSADEGEDFDDIFDF